MKEEIKFVEPKEELEYDGEAMESELVVRCSKCQHLIKLCYRFEIGK